MMKLKILLLVAFMAVLSVSCNVHEMPDEGSKVSIKLNLDYNTNIEEYLTMYADLGRASRSPEDYDVRYIVRAHLYINDDTYLPEAFTEFRFTRDDVDNLNYSTYINLSPGKYKIMVWTDFVEEGKDTDKFYAPDDFSNIAMTAEYDANNDFRDAFCGNADLNVDYSDLSSTANLEVTVPMERPLAKYYFITTDVEEFASRYLEMKKTKGSPTADPNADPSADIYKIDYDAMTLQFLYTGYLPCVFNMYTNRPIDSMTGVSFDSKITDITGTEATLGFDYVLVNGKESSVSVAVALYDTDGSLISMSNTVNVPLVRGKYTIVKGKFFSQNESSGVGIDPSFDGDWNVWVP